MQFLRNNIGLVQLTLTAISLQVSAFPRNEHPISVKTGIRTIDVSNLFANRICNEWIKIIQQNKRNIQFIFTVLIGKIHINYTISQIALRKYLAFAFYNVCFACESHPFLLRIRVHLVYIMYSNNGTALDPLPSLPSHTNRFSG